MHKFPRKGTSKYNKWLHAIPQDLITSIQDNAYICCMHFSKDAFQPSTSTKKNLLKRDAIPSIFYTEFEDVIDENDKKK